MSAPLFSPFAPGFREDPYPHYHRLREEDPVHQTAGGYWLLTAYDDIAAFLHDRRASSRGAGRMAGGGQPAPAGGMLSRTQDSWVLFREPPDHTYLRRTLNPGFTPKAIAGLRDHVERHAQALIEPLLEEGQMDLVADFAYPLATDMICELVGVPRVDRDKCHRWMIDILEVIHGGRFGTGTDLPEPESIAASRSAHRAFFEYFGQLAMDRRESPKDDLISLLVETQDRDGRLDTHDVVANALMMFAAGHDTTVGLVGNSAIALHDHPEQLEQVRARGLDSTGLDELLRHAGPVHAVVRIALEDLDYGGKTIEKGSNVLAILPAANRDPSHFPDPDKLDLDRRDARALAFGLGIHYCIGAPLARLETEIALGMLIRSTKDLEVGTEAVVWGSSLEFRTPRRVPLTFTAA